MPLRCICGEAEFSAYKMSDVEWQTLRNVNAQYQHLRMHCCDSGVTLKKSSLGTKFFAHKRKGECKTQPETAEHLFAKALVASALSDTAWLARTEVTGESMDGERWIADVLAEKEGRRVAFEIQWSPQTFDETTRRQARYANSNVRCLWFFRRPTQLLLQRETPTFLLTVDVKEKRAYVRLPSDRFSPYFSRDAKLNDDKFWSQEIELQRFIKGAMSGALKWAPGLNERVPFEIHIAAQKCWKCHKSTNIVVGLEFRVDFLYSGARSILGKLSSFDSPEGKSVLFDALKTINFRAEGVGQLKDRYSRTVGASYLSNGCVHCDALQGAFYEYVDSDSVRKLTAANCHMAKFLFSQNSQFDSVKYWWFNEDFRDTI